MDKEYMTIGQLAKKMKTTVRTLQFYDQKGLLKPSMQSEGGRRLYTYQDMVQLHQIQSLKSLGFSVVLGPLIGPPIGPGIYFPPFPFNSSSDNCDKATSFA